MKRIKKSFQALGTINSITVMYEEEAEKTIIKVLDEIKEKILELDDLLSVFKENSDIARINAAAGRDMVPVQEDTYYLIRKAVEYSQLTDGTFDITTRPLSRLWGIGKKGEYIPSDEAILSTLQLVNYKDILIRTEPNCVGLRKEGQEIDLGSIAKGYAADLAKKFLLEENIENAIINFGGTVIVLGEERGVGIQNPEKTTGTSMGILRLKEEAIVTSGWYERYFIKDGIRYHHILDPRTGKPADQGISSISLIGASAMELDALTTAVFVSGITSGHQYLEQHHLDGIFVTKDQDVFITQGIQERFSLIKEKECI